MLCERTASSLAIVHRHEVINGKGPYRDDTFPWLHHSGTRTARARKGPTPDGIVGRRGKYVTGTLRRDQLEQTTVVRGWVHQ